MASVLQQTSIVRKRIDRPKQSGARCLGGKRGTRSACNLEFHGTACTATWGKSLGGQPGTERRCDVPASTTEFAAPSPHLPRQRCTYHTLSSSNDLRPRGRATRKANKTELTAPGRDAASMGIHKAPPLARILQILFLLPPLISYAVSPALPLTSSGGLIISNEASSRRS